MFSKVQVFDNGNQLVIAGCSWTDLAVTESKTVNQKWNVNIKIFLAQLIIDNTQGDSNAYNSFGKHLETFNTSEQVCIIVPYLIRYVIIDNFQAVLTYTSNLLPFHSWKYKSINAKSYHSSLLLSVLFYYFDAWRCLAPG